MAQARLTRGQNEREDGAALKAERCADGQDPLDESAAALGLRSARDLPDEHAMPNGAFRRIVRGLDALDADERPKRNLRFEKFGAGARSLVVASLDAFREERLDARAQRTHVHTEGRA